MMDFANNDSGFCLADNIRSLRKRMKWSQEDLADKVGLNRGNIASYENGTAEPKICNLVKLATLFNLSVFDLTHKELKDDNTIEQATLGQRNSFAQPQPHTLSLFVKEAEDFQQAIKGLQCLVRLKTKNATELTEEATFLKEQFEQLYGLTEQLMAAHMELLAVVQQKCPKYGPSNSEA